MLKVVFLSSGSNMLTMIIKMVITFIMAPVLIRNLGNYDYGLWEMLGAVIGYMGILDLGLKPAISRHVSLYTGQREFAQRQLVYSSAFLYMSVIGLLLFGLCVYWAAYWPQLIAPTDSQDIEKYGLLIFIIGIRLLFCFPGFVAESALEGLKLYHVKNIITIINSVVGSSIVFNFIEPNNAILLLAFVNMIGLSVKYLIYFVILYVDKEYKLNPFGVRAKLTTVWMLMTFGFKSLVQGIATRIETASDTLIIGGIMGPAMVPFYSIPANFISHIRNISYNLSHVFMPIFSELSGQNVAKQKIQSLYFDASRVIIAITLLIASGVFMTGEIFIELWIGTEYSKDSFWLITLLLVFTVVPLLNPLASRYLTSVNKHGIFAKLGPISAVINIGLTIPLVYQYGIIGAAIGSVVPVLFFQWLYFSKCANELEFSRLSYVIHAFLPSVLPALLICLYFHWFISNWGIVSFTELIGASLVASVIYVICYAIICINKPEIKKLQKLIVRLKKKG